MCLIPAILYQTFFFSGRNNYPSLDLFPEKAMAPHSSTLAWKIPWTEEPGRRQSMGSHRVEHDWATSLSLFTFMHWRRKWQPTPLFLPGESQGRGGLVDCCLWGRTESDMTEMTQQQQQMCFSVVQSQTCLVSESHQHWHWDAVCPGPVTFSVSLYLRFLACDVGG